MSTNRKAPAAPPDTYGVVKVGWEHVVLPLADATRLIECFAKAERYEPEYDPTTGSTTHVGGKLPDISLTVLSGSDYMTGKLNGPKES